MAVTLSTVIGQTNDAAKANAKLKGMFVYQFAKNVDWPKEDKTGDFIIGVYGDETIYKQLSTSYTGKLIGSQPIKVIRYISSSEIKSCHILYISESKSGQVEAISKQIKSNNSLVITNKNGLLSSGSLINFIVKQNKLTFEINKSKAEKTNLIIGQTLTKLAANVL